MTKKELNLTAKDEMQRILLEHFTPLVSDALADKINNGVIIEKDGKRLINKKDLDTFMAYLAQKSIDDKTAIKLPNGLQAVGMEGNDVLKCAIHYFEEESIEGKLFYEDGTEYTPPKPKQTPTPVITRAPKQTPKPQLSMFDLLEEQKNNEPAPDEEDDDENEDEDNDEDDEPTEEEIAEAMQATITPPKQPTPQYQNYLNIQKQYADAVLAYRIGDFYEVLGNNAVKIANEFDFTLTSRDCGLDERVPMIGFPYFSADAYVNKLVKLGYKIVLAESLDPEDIKLYGKLCIDKDTGEILSDKPTSKNDVITVSQIVAELGTQAVSLGEKADDLKKAQKIMQQMDELPYEDDDEDDLVTFDTSAFDTEALSILDELFGSDMILR